MPAIVVIDTNVWVSAFINPHGAPAQIREAFVQGKFQVVLSVPLLDEIAEVLARPRIREKYKIDDSEIAAFLRALAERGIPVIPVGDLHVCRDPDDDLVLETALLGNARYMITRDDDLKRDQDLVAQLEAHQIAVLSVRQFLDRLAEL